jgi:hypothetical protein
MLPGFATSAELPRARIQLSEFFFDLEGNVAQPSPFISAWQQVYPWQIKVATRLGAAKGGTMETCIAERKKTVGTPPLSLTGGRGSRVLLKSPGAWRR